MTAAPTMEAGEVGYVITGHQGRDQAARRRHADDRSTTRPAEALPGYREVKPMVFCGLFPIDTDRYEDLREALDRLSLNDAALSWEPETSQALGFGFRCGFLGLLHMDIVRERLEREYDLDLLATTPNVSYEVELIGGRHRRSALARRPPRPRLDRRDPRALHPGERDLPRRPGRRGHGALPGAPRHARGHALPLARARPARATTCPLAEIVLDFFDQLKSRTAGYASLDYEPTGLRASDLVKLDILLAGEPVDASVGDRPPRQGL